MLHLDNFDFCKPKTSFNFKRFWFFAILKKTYIYYILYLKLQKVNQTFNALYPKTNVVFGALHTNVCEKCII